MTKRRYRKNTSKDHRRDSVKPWEVAALMRKWRRFMPSPV